MEDFWIACNMLNFTFPSFYNINMNNTYVFKVLVVYKYFLTLIIIKIMIQYSHY